MKREESDGAADGRSGPSRSLPWIVLGALLAVAAFFWRTCA